MHTCTCTSNSLRPCIEIACQPWTMPGDPLDLGETTLGNPKWLPWETIEKPCENHGFLWETMEKPA